MDIRIKHCDRCDEIIPQFQNYIYLQKTIVGPRPNPRRKGDGSIELCLACFNEYHHFINEVRVEKQAQQRAQDDR